MGENEQWKIKVDIKDDKLKEQVDAVVNATFTLYRDRPQFGIWPVVDSEDSFHLIYANEKNEEKWIELFSKSVVDYINGHFLGSRLQCSVKEGVLTFKKQKEKKDD